MLFFWTFYSLNNPEAAQMYSTAASIIIRNVSWAVNKHIRMISEGLCDTKDRSNDVENSALHHRNHCFWSRKIRDFFQKHKKMMDC